MYCYVMDDREPIQYVMSSSPPEKDYTLLTFEEYEAAINIMGEEETND